MEAAKAVHTIVTEMSIWLSGNRFNSAGFLRDEDLECVEAIAREKYEDESGNLQPFLTEEEKHSLMIRRGTLTDEERKIMQNHVVMTKQILDQVSFPEIFSQVPVWAASHHELINGKGYPDMKSGDHIPVEVRLLTILDIYEALTAKNRPYKKPMPPEKAFAILSDMVKEGSIDGELLELFRESRAWDLQ